MRTEGWDDGRLLIHELLDANAGFDAFVDGDTSQGLTASEGLVEARRHLETFLALEVSSDVFVPKNVRTLVGISMDALDRGQIEVALAALRRASITFQEHLERERHDRR